MTEEEINQIIKDVQGKNGRIAKNIAVLNISQSLQLIPLLQAYIKTLETENLRLIDEFAKIKTKD